MILKAEHISYSYKTKYQTIQALKDVSCSFEEGKIYAIVGKSGCGKSTLLSLLAGLDVPDSGRIYVDGKCMDEMDRDLYRKEIASVIYQSFNLFELLTAVENVMYPLELKGVKQKEARVRAEEFIKKVGLDENIYTQYPKMMSGGEQQRIAIARGLASDGKILLADEPTGNLDSENETMIVELLKKAAHEIGYTVIVITHNPQVAKEADQIFRMNDGRMEAE